ncbi:MAG: hypothetical protein ACKVP5_06165 [Aestuariivirga sp.]
MSENTTYRVVEAALKKIEDERVRLQQELNKLNSEAERYRIALDVLRGIGSTSMGAGDKPLVLTNRKAIIRIKRSRPEGIPTTREMGRLVLSEAGKALSGREIVEAIDSRWWPGVTPNDIIPTLTKLAKKKRDFKRYGALFKLVENREGQEYAPDPSQRSVGG